MKTQDITNEDQPEPGLEPFVTEFIHDRLSEIETLRVDLEKKNFHKISSICHKFKGFCKPYGFAAVLPLVAQLDQEAKDGEPDKCLELINEINNYFLSKAALHKINQ